jgi:peptide/nickel transport system permease protein
MILFVARRLLHMVGVLWVVTLIIFGITHVLPGNVAVMILGEYQNPELLSALEKKLGLKDPLPVQYWRWFSGILRGDLGRSVVMERPVAPILWERLERSAGVALIALFCVTVIGIVFGVLAAVHENRPLDHAVSLTAFLGISVPEFFWGIVLILVVAGSFNLLPAFGYVAPSQDPVEWLKRIILPVVTLTFALIAHVSRMTRSSMLDVLRTQYIRAARARGLPRRSILYRHALRNALLPTVTVLAVDFGFLIGGLVVVEAVFAFPGLGGLFVFAVQQRDLPLIEATVLVVAAAYGVANLIADVLYTYLDPRIRFAEARRAP